MKNLRIIGFTIVLVFCCNSPKENNLHREMPKNTGSLRASIEIFEHKLKQAGMIDSVKAAEWAAADSVINYFAEQYAAMPERKRGSQLLTSYFWDTLGIAFDTARNKINNILPEKVVKQRRGSCLGISLLMLAAGEKLGLPLRGVLVPGHFFVRYRNGTAAENIDAMKKGESKPDTWYAERFGAPGNATCYLKDLDNHEIIAVLDYNIANILLAGKNYKQATDYYSRALAAMPDFIEAAGNYAIALSETGKTDSALTIIRSLKADYPDFKNIDATLGKLLLKKGDFSGALDVLKDALRKDPRNPELLYCAGLSCYYLKKCSESESFLQSALNIKPDFDDARMLLDKARIGNK